MNGSIAAFNCHTAWQHDQAVTDSRSGLKSSLTYVTLIRARLSGRMSSLLRSIWTILLFVAEFRWRPHAILNFAASGLHVTLLRTNTPQDS